MTDETPGLRIGTYIRITQDRPGHFCAAVIDLRQPEGKRVVSSIAGSVEHVAKWVTAHLQ